MLDFYTHIHRQPFWVRALVVLVTLFLLLYLWHSRFALLRHFVAPADMRFSNTQTWGLFLRGKENFDYYTGRQFDAISLASPSANDAPETLEEISTLHKLAALREPDVLARIDRERFDLKLLSYNNALLKDFAYTSTRPHTSELLDHVLYDFDAYILHFKRTIDRVRPTILDPSLSVAFPVPGHPSYPSGHSSQSHLIAMLLSDLDPLQEEAYLADAWRIATDREIAGFHYRSDTLAGRSLAQQYYQLLQQSELFRTDFARAQTEW
jgi:hypothetical protein